MGNVLAQPKVIQPEPVSDLPNVVLKDTLGRGRFLKTLLCLHDEGGLVVVKAYYKRADSPSLGPYKQQLARLRASLHGLPCPHVWPWQAWVDTASAGYLMRQHLASGLNDRLSTRPFLTHAQKRWIAFQLLHAVAQSHEAGCCHGDIKTENVLLTSWSWVFLSDYAPFKPTFLPADNPAEFSFYFDTGGRRRCYIAPERFFSTAASNTSNSAASPLATAATAPTPTKHVPATNSVGSTPSKMSPAGAPLPNSGGSGPVPGRPDPGVFVRGMSMEVGGGSRPLGPLTPAMDIFSLGCTIAELFLDGRTVMDLGQLLGYSRGEWDPAVQGPLSLLDPDLRQMVQHMIQLNPASRWRAQDYLEHWGPVLFPSYFEKVLHPFFDSLLPLDADARIAAAQGALPLIKATMLQEPTAIQPNTPLVTTPSHHMPVHSARIQAGATLTSVQHSQQHGFEEGGTHAEQGGTDAAGSGEGEGMGDREGGLGMHSGSKSGGVGDVGALLDDAARLMHAMQGQHQRSSSGDALFMLDEAESEQGGAAAVAAKRSDEESGGSGGHLGDSDLESVTDMCYEWQFRELADAAAGGGGSGAWAPASPDSSAVRRAMRFSSAAAAAAAAPPHNAGVPSGKEAWEEQGRGEREASRGVSEEGARRPSRRQLHPFRSKEGVGLPAEAGWAWEDASWQVVGLPSGVSSDSTGENKGGLGVEDVGWEYCQAWEPGRGAGEAGTHTGGEYVQWDLACQPRSFARRRLWQRRRLRHGGGGGSGSSHARRPPPLGVAEQQQQQQQQQQQHAEGDRDSGLDACSSEWGLQARTALETGGGGTCRSPPSSFPLAASHLTSMTSSSPPMTHTQGTHPHSPSLLRGAGAQTSQPSLPSSRNLLSSSEERTDGSFEGEEYARMGALNVGGRVGAALRGEEHGGSRADGGLGSNGAGRTGQGMVVVVVLLCSQLRGARLTESKLSAVSLLVESAAMCDDDVRLQCVVPYLATLLSDGSSSVRCLALRALVQVMCSVQAIPPSDAKVFQDYVLPSLSLLPNDPEESVRVEYAAGIARLAAAAHLHLIRLQHASNLQQAAVTQRAADAAKTAANLAAAVRTVSDAEDKNADASQPQDPNGASQAKHPARTESEERSDGSAEWEQPPQQQQQQPQLPPQQQQQSTAAVAEAAAVAAGAAAAAASAAEAAPVRFDGELALVRSLVEKVVLELITGVKSTAEVKRSLLAHAVPLAVFFGRSDLNDALLPLIITCLNASEWQLRSAFFQAVAAIAPHTGRESLDVFLLPCLEQALTDNEAAVVCDAVRCMAAVAKHLRKRSLLAAARKVTPLLRHPSPAVRYAAITFSASAARSLPAADVYAQLLPMVESNLRHGVAPCATRLAFILAQGDDAALAACLKQAEEECDDEEEGVRVPVLVQQALMRASATSSLHAPAIGSNRSLSGHLKSSKALLALDRKGSGGSDSSSNSGCSPDATQPSSAAAAAAAGRDAGAPPAFPPVYPSPASVPRLHVSGTAQARGEATQGVGTQGMGHSAVAARAMARSPALGGGGGGGGPHPQMPGTYLGSRAAGSSALGLGLGPATSASPSVSPGSQKAKRSEALRQATAATGAYGSPSSLQPRPFSTGGKVDDALLVPHFAPVYVCELPETPAAVTAAATTAAQLASLPPISSQPSATHAPTPSTPSTTTATLLPPSVAAQPPQQQQQQQYSVPSSASQQQLQQLQHHRQQLTNALQQLHACAVASLRPGASRHAAAIASIQPKVAVAEAAASLLSDRISRDPSGTDQGERLQLDRLHALLARLRSVPSSSSAPFSLSSPDALSWQTPPDVRPQPALTTFQLAQLSSRQMSGATAALSGVAGHRAGGQASLLQPHQGDYFTASGPSSAAAAAAAAHPPPSVLSEAVGTALAMGGAGSTSAVYSGPGSYATYPPLSAYSTAPYPSSSGSSSFSSTGVPAGRSSGSGAAGAASAALPPPTPSQLNNLAVAAGVGGVGEPSVKAHGGGGSVGGSSLYALCDGGGGGGGYGGGAGQGGGGAMGGGQWRPRGVLLGHLMEHRKAVTQMAVAYSGDFFVSASADETVKVWDLRRLERDVAFHSQLTYAAQPGGRITSVAAVEDDASVASASATGSIHVWRVDVARRRAAGSAGGASGGPEKYHGVIGLRQLDPGSGAVLDMCSWGPNVLLYITQHGGVHAWDLRVKQDVWRLPCPPSMGLTEHLICEPCGFPGNPVVVPGGGGTWLMTGGSKGHCRLWDVRFQLPASTWQHPTGASINAMAPALAPASRLGLSHDSLADLAGVGAGIGGSIGGGSASSGAGGGALRGGGSLGGVGGPLVYVAAGPNEVALWDAAAGRVHQVMRCVAAEDPTTLTAHSGPNSAAAAAAAAATARTQQQVPSALQPPQQQPQLPTPGSLDVLGLLASPQPRVPGIRCVLPLHSGLLLTGSSDRCIRCWDGARPSYSYLMAGPLWANDTLLSAPPSALEAAGGPGSAPNPQHAMGFAVPQFRYQYSSNSRTRGVPVVEEQCSLEGVVRLAESSQELRQKMRVHDQSHGDALTHMVAAEGYGGGRVLLTSARDGCIKAWK